MHTTRISRTSCCSSPVRIHSSTRDIGDPDNPGNIGSPLFQRRRDSPRNCHRTLPMPDCCFRVSSCRSSLSQVMHSRNLAWTSTRCRHCLVRGCRSRFCTCIGRKTCYQRLHSYFRLLGRQCIQSGHTAIARIHRHMGCRHIQHPRSLECIGKSHVVRPNMAL